MVTINLRDIYHKLTELTTVVVCGHYGKQVTYISIDSTTVKFGENFKNRSVMCCDGKHCVPVASSKRLALLVSDELSKQGPLSFGNKPSASEARSLQHIPQSKDSDYVCGSCGIKHCVVLRMECHNSHKHSERTQGIIIMNRNGNFCEGT